MKNFFSLSITILGIFLIGYHVFQLWTSHHSSFHQDEYQHVHMAWNVLSGKLIYRDFFDTHGPLSAWIFSGLLKIKSGAIASIDSLFYLRNICLSFLYLSFVLLFCCLQLFTPNLALNLIALALFAGQLTIQVTAFRIRPDVFMLASFLSFLIFWMRQRRFFAGIFLGVTIGLNPKFIFFNVPILIFDFLNKLKSENSSKEGNPPKINKIQTSRFALLAGELLVFILISCIQAFQGNLVDSLDSQFLNNFRVVALRVPFSGNRFALLRGFLELDSLLLFCYLGFIGWISFLIYRRHIDWSQNFKLVLMLSVCGLLQLAAPMSHHGTLLSLPCFIMLMSYVVDRALSKKIWGQSLFLILAILTAAISYQQLPKYNSSQPNLRSLSKALSELPRTEPIFYIWPNRCPAYIFNSDHGKYWGNLVQTPEMDSGRDINRFLDPQIKWVAIDDVLFPFLLPTERDYLTNHFVKSDCLWQRK
ncbi:MAG: hypothetical protein FJ112_11835 [Deltaproteobacteria bacterium]|nr:hypothetical protein [Deltaproteobacteria bacterium]